MNEPLFRIGQRVYNRANPYHGKVIAISEVNGEWLYTLAMDLPNPSNESQGNCFEAGLRATLEEAVAWQDDFNDWAKNRAGWICLCGFGNVAPRVSACRSCGRAIAESFPNGIGER